ncbi:MAG: SEC-C metal-binding domain-containing protein [Bacteroidota bacterium]
MSLSLILDKSTFQMLNIDEVVLLHNYYKPNITPILVMEVLGDLKKGVDSGEISKDRVVDFSKKLLPYNSVVNVHFQQLIAGDLVGHSILTEFRPLVGNVTPMESATGKLGFNIQDSHEEKALSRWRDGEFSDIDTLLAELWRESTTQKDILQNLKDAMRERDVGDNKIKNIDQLILYVDGLLNSDQNQTNVLHFIVSEFDIDSKTASDAFLRWEQSEKNSVAFFAPYAFYCCRVKLLFYLILKNDFFGGVKPTNLLDLQYLYYLPFCVVFSSNDNFHKKFVPLVIDKYQTFVIGQDLKSDLKNLVSYRSTLSEQKDIVRTLKEPPLIYTSQTYQLWTKYFDFPPKYKRQTSEKEIENAKSKMEEFIAASKLGKQEQIENPDFFVKEMFLKLTDLCPCGSGKQLKECHLKRQ